MRDVCFFTGSFLWVAHAGGCANPCPLLFVAFVLCSVVYVCELCAVLVVLCSVCFARCLVRCVLCAVCRLLYPCAFLCSMLCAVCFARSMLCAPCCVVCTLCLCVVRRVLRLPMQRLTGTRAGWPQRSVQSPTSPCSWTFCIALPLSALGSRALLCSPWSCGNMSANNRSQKTGLVSKPTQPAAC